MIPLIRHHVGLDISVGKRCAAGNKKLAEEITLTDIAKRTAGVHNLMCFIQSTASCRACAKLAKVSAELTWRT